MSFQGMVSDIDRNIYYLAKVRYPWLLHIPKTWPKIVKFFELYSPNIDCQIIYWTSLDVGFFKCNSDGTTKGNPGPNCVVFCIRDREGDFIYTKTTRLENGINLVK